MRLLILVGCVLLVSACQGEVPETVGQPRPQTAQITYVGGMFLNSSLNSIVAGERSIRKRRRSLRKPLQGLYELLKGPEVVRRRTEAVSAIYRPFGKDPKLPDPGLAEIFSLAGIDTVTLAVPVLAASEKPELVATRKALDAVGISSIGLTNETSPNSVPDLDVRIVDLKDAKVALVGLYLTDSAWLTDGASSARRPGSTRRG